MFDADRPILNSEQDRLGRTTFAKYLARCILDHKAPESLVVGLYGGWGVGKTSVINLTLEELRYASSNMFDDEQPIILNFSPWSYSGQNQLIYSFFRRLSSEMRNSPNFENSEKIIHLLELYISFFTHQPVPTPLRPKHSILTKIFKPKLKLQETYGWESGRDLTMVKAELNTLLKKQKHKIIVFIDNISRLNDIEINQVFQIVKSIGDYNNTVYVLSLDKHQVIKAMDRIHGSGGAEFLEKLVQLPFEIPNISKQDLESIFLEKMEKIIATLPADSWDKTYWADLYYSCIKHLFDNCRDITRYVNTVSFGYSRVKDVVNPVDFFAISAVYTFSPQVYYGVRDNRDLFTDLMDNVIEPTKEKLAEDKARCDEILSRNGRIPQDMLLQLLIRLFPRLRNIYQAKTYFFHSEAIARKNRRICTPDLFEVYFRLSIPTGYISDAEINAILSSLQDEEGFALALMRLNQDEKIIKFLDLLDSLATTKISPKYIGNIVKALIDSGDFFPEGETSPLSFSTLMRIHRIIHQLLRRFEISQHRFDIMKDAIDNANNSIYSIIHELIVQSQEHMENEDTQVPVEERDFTPEQLDALKQCAVKKIISWIETKRLSEHPKLIEILFAWQAWGDPSAPTRYVKQLIQTDRGVVDFLVAALKDPVDQAISKLQKKEGWEKYILNIESLVPISEVEKRAKDVFEDQSFEKLREREQLAILIFLDLIKSDTVKVIPKTWV